MPSPGQIVQCAATAKVGITYGKYYTVLAAKDCWVTVINDAGTACRIPEADFHAVNPETPAQETFTHEADAASREPAAVQRGPDHNPVNTAPARTKGNGETILVVDDNARLRRTTAEMLRILNYRVLEAEDGGRAIACLQTDRAVDLLFTDIVMPGDMTGFDLARASIACRPDLKILLTTGFPLAPHGALETRHLAWPLIGKPYRMRELERHIANLLENRDAPATTQPSLTAADNVGLDNP